MKKELFRTCLPLVVPLALTVSPPEAVAQVDATNTALRTNLVAPQWRVRAREAHQTEWQSVRSITNPVTRHVRTVTNSYIELSTGLNYRDPSTGRWQPSDPAFRITERGAESTAGQHTVLLAPDIGTLGSVTVRKGDLTMQLHPLCVAYYDPVDGRSVRLAEITNAIGYLVNSNEVVYSNCFNGLRASIRIRNSRAGIEQDLLIHAQPEFTPADFGFSRLTRLEMFSEFVGDSPMPQVSTRVLYPESPPAGVTRLSEQNFTDSTLNFGLMEMNAGRAFTTDQQSRTEDRKDSSPVGKSFVIIDGRRILVEAVPVRHIERSLNDLPRTGANGGLTNAASTRSPLGRDVAVVRKMKNAEVASTSPRSSDSSHPVEGARATEGRVRVSEVGVWRAGNGGGAAPMASLSIFHPHATGEVRSLPPRPLAVNNSLGQKIQTASTLPLFKDEKAGANRSAIAQTETENDGLALVIDFLLVGSGGPLGGVFLGDTTYRVSGEVWLSTAVTFEGGTVIKFNERNEAGNPVYAILYLNGPVSCKTELYHPAVFTSVYDNSAGEVISTQANPSHFYQALAINNYTTTTLSNIQVRYAQYAIHTGGLLLNLRHAQFAHCDTVFYPEWATWKMGNVLVYDSGEVFSSGSYYNVQATHITVNGCSRSLLTTSPSGNPAGCQVAFHNHILANIASLGTLPADRRNITGNDLLTGNNIFSPAVGGGFHYLSTPVSSLRDSAFTPISDTDFPGLQAELRQMTTWPPQEVNGQITEDTVWPWNYNVPVDYDLFFDRGYHYPKIDWLVKDIRVWNATLQVTEGAVVAVSVGGASAGIRLDSGGIFISEAQLDGDNKIRINKFIRPHAVQEDTGTLNQQPMFDTVFPVSDMSIFQARFTEIPLLSASVLFSQQNGQSTLQSMTLRDCQLKGGIVYLSPGNAIQTIFWTNTLFERVNCKIYSYPPMTIALRNNTFVYGAFQLWGSTVGSWSIYDNLFYKTVLYQHPYAVFDHDFNGYITGASRFLPVGDEDAVVPDFAFQGGPLGRYYLPANCGLIDQGSRTASAAGLYHFTTTTAQSKDGTSAPSPYLVDIGRHYVALNSNGGALNTDADLLPDFVEDINGNGVEEPGESPWGLDSDGDGVSDQIEVLLGRRPLVPGWEWDTANILKLQGNAVRR